MPTEKNKNQFKNKANESKTSIVATTLIFISIMIILSVNTFCTLSICRPDLINKIVPTSSNDVDNSHTYLSDAEKIESSLLANGLSIIGIFVAVWASLSIANSINKKDFEKTKSRMSVAEKDIAKLEKIIAPLKDEASGIKNTMRDLLLQGIKI